MDSRKRTTPVRLALLAAATLPLLGALPGCASGSHAAEGASRGATTGVVSGAVGGLVGALVFGGDPAESAARGAVYGGAVGATAGAIRGSEIDAQEKKRREAGLAQLRKDIGDSAYASLEALVDCRHKECLSKAAQAQESSNPNHALAGLWLEALCYAEQGDDAQARALFPRIIEADWDIEDEAQAESHLRASLTRLAEIRAEYGKPTECRG